MENQSREFANIEWEASEAARTDASQVRQDLIDTGSCMQFGASLYKNKIVLHVVLVKCKQWQNTQAYSWKCKLQLQCSQCQFYKQISVYYFTLCWTVFRGRWRVGDAELVGKGGQFPGLEASLLNGQANYLAKKDPLRLKNTLKWPNVLGPRSYLACVPLDQVCPVKKPASVACYVQMIMAIMQASKRFTLKYRVVYCIAVLKVIVFYYALTLITEVRWTFAPPPQFWHCGDSTHLYSTTKVCV